MAELGPDGNEVLSALFCSPRLLHASLHVADARIGRSCMRLWAACFRRRQLAAYLLSYFQVYSTVFNLNIDTSCIIELQLRCWMMKFGC